MQNFACKIERENSSESSDGQQIQTQIFYLPRLVLFRYINEYKMSFLGH